MCGHEHGYHHQKCGCHARHDHGHHSKHHHNHHQGNCCHGNHGESHLGFKRRYVSPTEKRGMLEQYIDQLKKELEGAEAALKSLISE